ncbi:MAG: anti-sigma factor antagonist [Chloroflexaceae bacterium]
MESITLTANLEALARISAFITAAARRAGLDERTTWQAQLAVDEAATNVIQHAYAPEAPGDITLSWRSEGNRFIVTLRDFGRQFDPGSIPPPDLSSPLEERQAGGLGIYLITRLMDEVRFDFNPQGGNVLTMIKYVAAATGDDTLTFPVAGRVDAVTAPQLSRAMHEEIARGARRVVLDLSQVSFLSSSGLQALLLIRKELMALGGELRLAALQPQVRKVFDLTGFTQVFAIHPGVEEARAAFGQGRA